MRRHLFLLALVANVPTEESCEPLAFLESQLEARKDELKSVKDQALKATEELARMPEDFERIRKKVEAAKDELESREIRTRQELERQGVAVPPPEEGPR